MNPLAASRVTCLLPVQDLARARRFYEEALATGSALVYYPNT